MIGDWFKKFIPNSNAPKRSTSQDSDKEEKKIGGFFTRKDTDRESRLEAAKQWVNYLKQRYEENKDKRRTVSFEGSRRNRENIFNAVDRNKIVNISDVNSSRFLTRDGEMLMPSESAMYGDTIQQTVQSTAVKSVKYDPKRNVCSLVFQGGSKSYDYRMTPKEFETFMEALSKGRYVNYHMKYYNRMPGYPLKGRKRR